MYVWVIFMEAVESLWKTALFWSSFCLPEHLSTLKTHTCISITVFAIAASGAGTFQNCWKVCISSRTDCCEGSGPCWITSHVYSGELFPSIYVGHTSIHMDFPSVIPTQGFPWALAVPSILLSRNHFPFLLLKSGREQITTGLLTCCAARSIEGEHSLNGDIHGRDIEGFKHDLEGQRRIKDCLAEITACLGSKNGLESY